jgi:hypothetical protein
MNKKSLDFWNDMMAKADEDHTEKQKKQLKDLQNTAEQYYYKIHGENYGINVWYYIAEDLGCSMKHVKNKWGRFRFYMPEFDNCDPGNEAYDGSENFKSVIAARKYLIRNYKKKYRL